MTSLPSPKISVDANVFVSTTANNTAISSWSGYTAVDSGSGLPVVKSDEPFRYVRFGTTDSSSTKGNYLNLGTQTWFNGMLENPAFTSNTSVLNNFYSTYKWETDAGWVVSTSSILNSSTDAHRAFNKTTADSGDCWHSASATISPTNPQWLRIKYPNPVIIVAYTIRSRNDATKNIFGPTAWRLQGSTNGTTWIDLESTRTDEFWGQNTLKEYNTNINTTNTAYTYYQLLIEGTRQWATGNANYAVIGNWSLFTVKPDGFTASGVIRFWQNKTNQRWFDFGNGADALNILYQANGGGTNISVYSSGSQLSQSVSGVLPIGNGWYIVIARVTSATLLESWANITSSFLDPNTPFQPKNSTTGTIVDYRKRTLTNNWIGRSNWSTDSYACLDVREMTFYDIALSDRQIDAINVTLRAKYTLLSNIKQISALREASIFLTNDGKLYSCGAFANGRLGNETLIADTGIRRLISNLTNIEAVSNGNCRYHTLAKRTNGDVYSFGYNNYSQLAILPVGDQSIPVKPRFPVSFIDQVIVKVACGQEHSLFLTDTGVAYGVGRNTEGQLGLGDAINRNSIVPLTGLSGIVIEKIYCGSYNSMFIEKTTGNIYACGNNEWGQLGLGNIVNRTNVPLTLLTYFTTTNVQTILDISASSYHTHFLTSNGTVFGCGAQHNGRLGNNSNAAIGIFTPVQIANTTLINIKQIVASSQSTLFLKTTGEVYATGYNNNGQLGTMNLTEIFVPTLLTFFTTQSPAITISQISIADTRHTLFLTSTGTVYACGNQVNGVLGNGLLTAANISTPALIPNLSDIKQVSAGQNASYFLTNSGNVYVCGAAANGRLGNGTTTGDIGTPTLLTSVNNIQSIVEGALRYHTIVISNTNEVFSFGYNNFGQLGVVPTGDQPTPALSFTEYFSVLDTKQVVKVSTGTNYSMHLTSDGLVYGCGINNNGQVGTMNITQYVVPTLLTFFTSQFPPIIITQVSAGAAHTLFLTSLGKVYSCGLQTNGRLGNGVIAAANISTPFLISGLNNIKQVSAGSSHSLFVTNSGIVYGCGTNSFGQLGIADLYDQLLPIQITALSAIKIVEVVASTNHSAFIDEIGISYVCGYNVDGTLNISNYENQVVPYKFSSGTGYSGGVLLPNNNIVFVPNASDIKTFDPNAKNILTTSININTDSIKVKSLSDGLGVSHQVAILDNNILYSNGLNANGQLGLGVSITSIPEYNKLAYFTSSNIKIIEVALGSKHTLHLTDTGTVYSSGANNAGQLGLGDLTNRFLPYKITALNGVFITKISARNDISLFLSDKGTMYACGVNTSGELGLNDLINRNVPTIITRGVIANKNIASISAGGGFSVCLEKNGRVYSSGSNSSSNLGLSISTVVPRQFNALDYFTTQNIKIIQIATGNNHTLYLTNTGTVYASGLNSSGQLGLGDTTNRILPYKITALNGIFITKIDAHRNTSLFLTDKGTLYGCGVNTSGQLGLNDIINKTTPTLITQVIGNKNISNTSIGLTFSLCLEKNGRVYSSGLNTSSELGLGLNAAVGNKFNPLEYFTTQNIKIIHIATGEYHTLYLTNTGTVYASGLNSSGQLGLGDTINRILPYKITALNGIFITKIDARLDTSMFLTDKGTLYGCGFNSTGQLGLNDTTNKTIPTLITEVIGTKNISNMSIGNTFSMCVENTGRVYSSGQNTFSELGLGLNAAVSNKFNPLEYFTTQNIKIIYIATGANHTLYLTNTGTVYASGLNGNGQLGLGDTTNRILPYKITAFNGIFITKIDARANTSLFLTDKGALYGCGLNTSGQLGLNDIINKTTPTLITEVIGTKNISSMSVGNTFSLSLEKNGRVYSSGSNTSSELGLSLNAVVGNKFNPLDYFTTNNIKVIQVATGSSHTLYLSDTGIVYASGLNGNGQLGLGDTINRILPYKITALNGIFITKIDARGDTSLFLTDKGAVYGCGGNTLGQLGLDDIINKTIPTLITEVIGTKVITNISAGSTFSLCVEKNGRVYSSGLNTSSELGLSINTVVANRFNPLEYFTTQNIKIIQIATGSNHTLYLSDTGTVYASGLNGNGQLGLGNTISRILPYKITALNGIFIIQIDARSNFSLFLRDNGTIYGCGLNSNRQIGGTDTNNVLTPIIITSAAISNKKIIKVSAGSTFSIFVSSDGLVYECGLPSAGIAGGTVIIAPTNITSAAISSKIIVDVSTGDAHAILIDSLGSAYCLGTGANQRLGNNSTSNVSTPTLLTLFPTGTKIASAYAGNTATIFSTTTGTVYVCGDNVVNIRRLGSTTNTTSVAITLLTNIPEFIVKASIGTNFCHYLSITGKVYAFGSDASAMGTAASIAGTAPSTVSSISSQFITQISTGTAHSIFLTRDNVAYSTGTNTNGQLGIGDVVARSIPVVNTHAIKFDDITRYKVASGKNHTVFINNSGLTYAFGTNTNGQLGVGNTTALSVPIVIPALKDINVRQIACGTSHSLFVENNGRVYACGSYLNGRLGISGLIQDVLVPTNIPAFNSINIIQVAEGDSHSLFLASTGKVYACGSYLNGRLGTGSTADVQIPVEITYFTTNSIFITQISAGDSHSMFLDYNGSVYVCGSFSNGRLGTGSTADVETPILLSYFTSTNPLKIKQVSCGSNYTLFLTTSGSVYVCGSFAEGRLGTGSTSDEPVPILLSVLSNVRKVIAGYSHTLFLAGEGVYATGLNTNGQLGIANTTSQTTPVLITSVLSGKNIIDSSCGSDFSIFITNETNSLLYSCGSTTSTNDISTILYVSKETNTEIVSLSTGNAHTVLIDNLGNAHAFGAGGNNQLGTNNTATLSTPMLLTPFTTFNIKIASVTCGDSATIFLTTTGTVWVCGNNVLNVRRLGAATSTTTLTNTLLTTTNLSEFIVKASIGTNFCHYLSNTGKVYAFGSDGDAMGAGGTTNIAGGVAATLVSSLSSQFITQISAGLKHTLFLTRENVAFSTGLNSDGQLGIGDTIARATPVINTHAIKYDDISRYKVASGTSHTLFINNSGLTYAVGTNTNGQLGFGNTTSLSVPTVIPVLKNVNICQIACSVSHSLFVESNGRVYACGSYLNGRLGISGLTQDVLVPTNIPAFNSIKIVQVAAGDSHSLFLASTGRVYACGSYLNGRLGISNSLIANVLTPIEIPYFRTNSIFITQISAGDSHSMFLDANGIVYACGNKESGRLGTGNTYIENIRFPVPLILPNNLEINEEFTNMYIGDDKSFYQRNGKIYVIGENSLGDLGVGDVARRTFITELAFFTNLSLSVIDIKGGRDHTVFLCSNGNVYVCGANTYGQIGNGLINALTYPTPQLVSTLSNITWIGSNDSTIYAKSGTNIYYSWGRGIYGELLNNSNINNGTPTAITYFDVDNITTISSIIPATNTVHVIKTNATAFSAGLRNIGQFGIIEQQGPLITPIQIEFLDTSLNNQISKIYGGQSQSIIQLLDGRIYGIGDNISSNLTDINTYTVSDLTLTTGFVYSVYSGYMNDNANFFKTLIPLNTGITTDTTNLNTCTNGYSNINTGTNFSVELYGYFYATITGTYTFTLGSDDCSYMWIGNTAMTGYTTTNALIKNGGTHGVILKTAPYSLTAGTYTPIRIQYGQGTSGCDLQLSYAPPVITTLPNTDGLLYSVYSGYMNDNTGFFSTLNPIKTGFTTNTTNISACTGGQYTSTSAVAYSVELYGYFYAATTGTYTFSLASEDCGYMWISTNALSGYTTANAFINNGGTHGITTKTATYSLTAGTYTPIRIQFGNSGTPGDLQFSYRVPGNATNIYIGTNVYYYQRIYTNAYYCYSRFPPREITYFSSQSIQLSDINISYSTTLFLTSTGALYICGTNEGLVGFSDNSTKTLPTLIPYFNTNNIQIQSIFQNVFTIDIDINSVRNIRIGVIDINNTIYVFGKREWIGYDTLDAQISVPISLSYFTRINPLKIKQVSCGSDYTLLLTTSGSVYVCGSFIDGRLGTGSTSDEQVPILLSTLSNVRKVIAGYNHTLFLTGEGIYATGLNTNGQLGIANTTTQTTPVLITSVLSGKNIIDASCGSDFSVFITNETNSLLYSCGSTTSTNVPATIAYVSKETNTEIVSMSTGNAHTILIDNVGNAYGFGNGGNFRLGTDNVNNLSTPMLLTFFTTNGFKIASAATDDNCTFFVTTTGRVYLSGNANPIMYDTARTENDIYRFGGLITGSLQLQTFFTTNNLVITQVSILVGGVLFLTATGQIYGVGYNLYGEILSGNTVQQDNAPKLLNLSLFFTRLFTGLSHAFYLTRDEFMYCSGLNTSGQLGIGDAASRNYLVNYITPVLKYDEISAYAIASGRSHTLLINNSGLTYAFGINTNGQLGFGNTTNILLPTIIPALKDINIRQIACGASHSLFVESTGRVYACGSYLNGRLGISGLTQDVLVPTNIPAFNSINIIQVAAGDSHSLFLASTGRVYACGSYLNGRLGTGSTADVLTPVEITYFTINSIFITQISAGDSHSMFLDSDSNVSVVYTCGSYLNGRLGTGSATDVLLPTEISSIKTTSYIITNREAQAYLDRYPDLQAGYGSTNITAAKAHWYSNGYTEGRSKETGTASTNPLKIKQVSCGSDYTLFLTTSGSVYVCGSFADGRLGTGSTSDEPVPILLSALSNVRKVIAGYSHTLFLTGEGVYATGLNTNGQLGISNTTTQTTPVLIASALSGKNVIDASGGGTFSLFITNETNSLLYSCGSTTSTNDISTIAYVSKETNTEIVSVSTGDAHTILIDNVGNAYGVGNGGNFRLGTDNGSNLSTPMLLTFFTTSGFKIASAATDDNCTFFVTTTGRVYLSSNENPLIYNTTGTNDDIYRFGGLIKGSLQVQPFFTTNNLVIKQVSILTRGALFLTTTGKIYGVGWNLNGEILSGDTIEYNNAPRLLSSSLFFTSLFTGAYHTFYLTRDEFMYCSGYNGQGQLGIGDAASRNYLVNYTTPVLKYDEINAYAAASGTTHTLLINNSGLTYAFGINTNGQLGLGNTINISLPTIIPVLKDINIRQIACSVSHSLFMESTGRVYACGSYLNGRIGISGLTQDVLVPTNIPYFNTIKIVQVAAGDSHSLFLASTGRVYACGSYLNGRLGTGSVADVLTPVEITYFTTNSIFISQISAGDSHSMFLDYNGVVYACGSFSNGRLGTSSVSDILIPIPLSYFTSINPLKIKQVSCGSDYTLFLTTSGSVYVCGSFVDGRLGTGSTSDEPVPILLSTLSKVRKVIAGYTHTLFLTGSGVYSTGLNTNGQLGIANTTTQTTPVLIASVLSGKNIIDASCGSDFSIFITNEGNSLLYSCGSTTGTNYPSTIAYLSKETNTEIVSMSTGDAHTILIDNVGNAYGFGNGGNFRLGTDNVNNLSTPMLLTFFTTSGLKIASAATDDNCTFFVTTTGRVYLSGNVNSNLSDRGNNNDDIWRFGNLTTGYQQWITFFSTNNLIIKQVSILTRGVLFLTTTGQIYGVGWNSNGEILSGDTNLLTSPRLFNSVLFFTSLFTGAYHTFYLTRDETMYCSGYNGEGQLGIGDIASRNYLVNYITPALKYDDISAYAVASGRSHTLLINNSGLTYAFGINTNGQLGLGNTINISLPTIIPVLKDINIRQIACGASHSLFMESTGRVYACGSYLNGRLGISGLTQDVLLPTNIPAFNSIKIVQIATKNSHSLFLEFTGRVYACGSYLNGRLGTGSVADVLTPVEITYFTTNSIFISQISAGDSHSMFLDTNGIVYACGSFSNGRLGTSSVSDILTPIPLLYFTSINPLKIKQVSCGSDYTLFLTTSESVYVCGSFIDGRLGTGSTSDEQVPILLSTLSKVRKVIAGYTHTLFLTGSGVYSTGLNTNGQLGIANTMTQTIPVLITSVLSGKNIIDASCGSDFSVFITNEGNSLLYSCGSTTSTNVPTTIAYLSKETNTEIVSISTGDAHTILIDNVGNAYGFGNGGNLRLGTDNENNLSTPMLLTFFTISGLKIASAATDDNCTFFVTTTGRVYLSGNVNSNLSDRGNNNDDIWRFGNLTTGYQQWITFFSTNNLIIKQVSILSWGVLFLTTTGQIYGVGHNQNGEILSGDTNLLTSPRLFSSSLFFSRLFTGTNHVFYLTRDEIMYCSGLNTSGQLGLQDLNNRGSLVSNTQAIKYTDISAYKVASGYYHTIFINNSGLTYAFGTNTNGQLGFGNTITLFVPTVIPVLKDINICQIACGAFHSFFIESNGRVYACGSYLNGRLGISGLTQDVLVPTNIPALNSIKIVQVVAGISHSLFLASTGRVYACGSYLNGRLGTGSVADVLTPIEIIYFSTNSIFITQISAGDSHSMFLDTNGVVYACGSFSNGRLGTSSITDVLTPISLTYFITIYPLKIKQVSCGSDYTMLLTVTGNVYVCGSFTNGKLGTGSLADEPLPILLSTLSSVRTIIAGYNHTLFLTRLGVYATGLNANGQLGINTIINQNIPVLITSVINVKNIIGASCGFSFSVFITNETTPIIYSCGSTTTTKVPLSISYLSKATNTEIVSASTGTSHTILIDNIGNAYVFGNGANYQLGTDSTTSFTTPMILTLFRNANIKIASVSCGDNATMFVTTTGEVYSCGYEVFASMLGAGGDIRLPRNIANYKLTYFTTNSIFIVKAILGNSHSLLLSNVGRVYAFGRDANAMGAAITPSTSNIASTTPSIVTTLNSLVIKDISTNWQHSLFLTNTGLVYSTGANANGQLGLADLTARSVPTIIPFLTDVKQASAGYFHSVFLLNDGTVYSCGLNSSGQLGLGDTTDRNIPVIVSALEGITIVKISATGYNTRFLSDTGFIYICGLNIYGQLGLRDYTNRIVPTISYLVTENFSEDFFSGGTLLPDGRVLFTPNNSDKLGIFNPTTNAFSYDISTKATSFANNYQGSSLLPDGRIIYAPNNDNTVGMLSGLSAVPLERCIHPTFNNF